MNTDDTLLWSKTKFINGKRNSTRFRLNSKDTETFISIEKIKFLLEMILLIQIKELLNKEIKKLIKFIKDFKINNLNKLLSLIIMKSKK